MHVCWQLIHRDIIVFDLSGNVNSVSTIVKTEIIFKRKSDSLKFTNTTCILEEEGIEDRKGENHCLSNEKKFKEKNFEGLYNRGRRKSHGIYTSCLVNDLNI